MSDVVSESYSEIDTETIVSDKESQKQILELVSPGNREFVSNLFELVELEGVYRENVGEFDIADVESDLSMDEKSVLEEIENGDSEELLLALNTLLGVQNVQQEYDLSNLSERFPNLASIESKVDTARKKQGFKGLNEVREVRDDLDSVRGDLLEFFGKNSVSVVKELFSLVDYDQLFSNEGGVGAFFREMRQYTYERLSRFVGVNMDELDQWGVASVSFALETFADELVNLNKSGFVTKPELGDMEPIDSKTRKEVSDRVGLRVRAHNEVGNKVHGYKGFSNVRTPIFVDRLGETDRDFGRMLDVNPRMSNVLVTKANEFHDSFDDVSRAEWGMLVDEEKIFQLLVEIERQGDEYLDFYTGPPVDTALKEYERFFGERAVGNLPSGELKWDVKFIHAVRDILSPVDGVPLLASDLRILRSQMLAIYTLFSTGKIEQIYGQVVDKMSDGDKLVDEEAEMRLKSKIAMEFLEKHAAKHGEYKEESEPERATVGLEAEYSSGLDQIIVKFNELKERLGVMDKDSDEVDENKRQLKKMLEEELLELEVLKTSLGGSATLMNAKTVPQLVANFGPIEAESVFEGWPSYREFVSSPAVDYKLMLRDVVNLCVRMGEMPNLNYHYSVGGVELSRDNAEASDVRAVLKSTGWLDEEKPLSNFEQELVDKGNLLGSEAYAKPFQDENGRYWYMPYHRIRDGGQSSFVAYNSDMIPEGYEIRSFSRSYGEPENFPNQVRTLSFISVSAQSLRSKQLVEKGVDLSEADLERVGSWEKFLNSWKSVIEKYGLEYVPLENRFMEMRLSDGGKRFVSLDPDDKKEYAHFMQDLEVLSRTNLEFRSEVRKLVTEYKRSMRQASYKDEIN